MGFLLSARGLSGRTRKSEGTCQTRRKRLPASCLRERRLSHLKSLEAESIYILREAVAEFARPVMLYSIGKDSSVMLRLAQKAFFPGKIPFPLLHIDTSYKFPEMIEFRDRYTREIGAELIVHQNQEALDAGANPFVLGTQKCCGLLKTKSLLDALAEGGFDAAFGGARRDEEKSRAKERIYSFRDSLGQWDPKNQRPGAVEHFQFAHQQGRKHSRVSALELDGAGRVALHPHGKNSHRAAVFREGARRGDARRLDRRDSLARSELLPGEKPQMVVPHALAGLRAVHGRDSLDADTVPENYRGDAFVPPLGARKPRHRPRRRRLDGDQEARGLFLMSAGGAKRGTRRARRRCWSTICRRTCCASPRRAAWTTANRR